MTYEPKKFDHLLGLPGFSDNALNTHFKLYEGYVTNTNKIVDELKSIAPGSIEMAELKRRFGWEFNGMRLHELFFSSMTKTGQSITNENALYQKIVTDFGSWENFETDFRNTATMRGIGWAILYHDKVADKLFNIWINEHDLGHLANCHLLLNLDLFEHAFMLDYNTNRADYINAFLQVVDWDVVASRL
jgi:Fe-Mn family superoxide dismutase